MANESRVEIPLRRFRMVSSRPFDDVVAALTAPIGRPEMAAFQRGIGAARSLADLEAVVGGAVGASNLMEFARFDLGEILRKASAGPAPRALRLVVGNPLIMKEMVRTAPDAGSYAPVTILVDERADGVHVSYDSMESLLAHSGSAGALAVARELDAKVEGLIRGAA